MSKDKGYVTAEELMARLEADPEWVRRRDERAARHAELVAKQRAEMEPEHAPLRRDLAAVGLEVRHIGELTRMNAPYPKAVPVLLRHLAMIRHPFLRQIIARALTAAEARGLAGQPLLRELKRETDSEARWAMANALTIVAVPRDADGLAALLNDPNFADVHERLGQALRNVKPSLWARNPQWHRPDPPPKKPRASA